MGMDAILCSLSAKRLAMLEEDPEVLQDLLDARHESEIPGLLDLGNTWHALDVLLGEGKSAVLGDAVLLRSGTRMAGAAKARLIAAARVADVAKALAALPATHVRDKFKTLAGKSVHGNYGDDGGMEDDTAYLREKVEKRQILEVKELSEALLSLTVLYTEAAKGKHSMLMVIV
ncbi:MAG: YfbM family protein [Myxococcota bacterium]|nr:YfbM family protein [Myxococcota bacterium]